MVALGGCAIASDSLTEPSLSAEGHGTLCPAAFPPSRITQWGQGPGRPRASVGSGVGGKLKKQRNDKSSHSQKSSSKVKGGESSRPWTQVRATFVRGKRRSARKPKVAEEIHTSQQHHYTHKHVHTYFLFAQTIIFHMYMYIYRHAYIPIDLKL